MNPCILAAASAFGLAIVVVGIIGACVYTGGWACVIAIVGGGAIAIVAAIATYFFLQQCMGRRG